MTTTEALVRRLADRAELEDLVARHTLWVDQARWDETALIFTGDVAVTSPRGEARGIEALVGLVTGSQSAYEATLHTKANLVIDLDGDTASVRANDIAIFAISGEEEAVAAGVHRYTARRTPAGWRFDSLEVVPFALTESIARAL
ncbi:nuclear transport factor 2 family protein [Glycomyces harbinensis]|uniref:SnoaL-like domain-containing protein n=1 Tax=Glycomyces harbinensis TaxID=58114 RepID=A0A1G6YPD8_9ACTN|nr:nuclear transport factor 2 family protein [Glycomyces harbinensis]SDD92374.1 SnoaL-like domain-containing protein [Glycomyces harbinensis]